MRYYIDDSSVFVFTPYDREVMKEALKKAKAKNVRLALKFGWSNLPRVITFEVLAPNTLKECIEQVRNALVAKYPESPIKTWGVIAPLKNW